MLMIGVVCWCRNRELYQRAQNNQSSVPAIALDFYIHKRRNSTSKSKLHNISKKCEMPSHSYYFGEYILLPSDNIFHRRFIHRPSFSSKTAISLTPPSGINKKRLHHTHPTENYILHSHSNQFPTVPSTHRDPYLTGIISPYMSTNHPTFHTYAT